MLRVGSCIAWAPMYLDAGRLLVDVSLAVRVGHQSMA